MVSSFLAKVRNLILAIIAIAVVCGSVVADFVFRHEIKGKARREIIEAGYELSAAGIINAISNNQLNLFEQFDLADLPYEGVNQKGMTPLHFAIYQKNEPAIEQLFTRKKAIRKSVDEVCVEGYTPLKRALEQQNFELADQLLKLGADINQEKEPGLPWLVDAMNRKETDLRDYLMENGADVNVRGTQPFFPYAMAARDNDIPLMKRLAEKKADTKVIGTTGKPLLLEAILEDETEKTVYLLSMDANPNEKGNHKYHPLAVAANNNDVDLMEGLIKHGAKVEIKGQSGKPLLFESVIDSDYKEIDLLLKKGSNPDVSFKAQDPLLIALQREDGYLQNMLIKHGANLDRNGPSGKHLIFEALESEDHDWLMKLINSGISINKKSAKGETLLMSAIKMRRYDLVDFLIDQGAKVDGKGIDKITPLHYAIKTGDTALARTLVQKKASLDFETFASIAYQRRDNPTLNLLLNAGMDPNVDLKGTDKRVFDASVADSSVDTARSLLQAGAEVKGNFWSALTNGLDDLVLLFLQEGEDPTQESEEGQTPLEFVLETKRFNLVHPLLEAGAHKAPMTDDGESWLFRMIREKKSDIAVALLKANISVGNGRANDGHTLLTWAIANEMTDVALELIKAEVDVNAKETAPASKGIENCFKDNSRFTYYLKLDSKITPLMMASAKGNHTIASALVKAGAKNTPSRRSNYPVSIAAWSADVRMMQILFGRNPDLQPRMLEVNLSNQRVRFFEHGQVTHSTICSSGKPGYRTKTGSFVITQKNRYHRSNLYDADMPNFMRLSCGDFGFHTGICPGYAASHGCIRLPDHIARRYFDKCKLGDLVIIKY